MGNKKMKIVIAGASSYIGKILLKKLNGKADLIALAKNPKKNTKQVFWRTCDLFSLLDAKDGLDGADIAVYLGHQVESSALLTQSSYEDMEAILADNFARAAKYHNIKEIIYLSGIIPDKHLSTNLNNQIESERILRAYGTPVTAIRAGLINRPNRLFLPFFSKIIQQLHSNKQPILLDDALNSLSNVILNSARENRVSNKKMTINDRNINSKMNKNTNFSPHINDVRSIQRVKLPAGKNADWVGKYYTIWLESLLNPWVKITRDKIQNCKISFLNEKFLLLELSYSSDRSTSDRALYYITNGLLTDNRKNERGRMEFRKIPDRNEVIIAIHDYTPALPWFLYYFTQSNAHLIVMHAFKKHLEKIGGEKATLYDSVNLN